MLKLVYIKCFVNLRLCNTSLCSSHYLYKRINMFFFFMHFFKAAIFASQRVGMLDLSNCRDCNHFIASLLLLKRKKKKNFALLLSYEDIDFVVGLMHVGVRNWHTVEDC